VVGEAARYWVNDGFADNDTDGDGDYAAVDGVWSAGGSAGVRCDAPDADRMIPA
jgi:hypothetical protein